MNRVVSLLVGAATVAGASVALATTPASAATAPVEGCQIIGGTNGIGGSSGPGRCGTVHADSRYILDYFVSDGNGVYTWHVPAGRQIVAGCNISSPFCDLSVRSSASGDTVTVSVDTADTSGVPFSLSATASVPEVCGKFIC